MSSYAEVFDLIERVGVLDHAPSEELRAMARFRNRIVHFYGNVDLRKVFQILQDRLDDFDRYLTAIEHYLSRSA